MESVVNDTSASWVVNLLRLDGYRGNRIAGEGLYVLKLTELGILWRALQPQLPSTSTLGIRLKSGTRKQEWVDTLENVLKQESIVQFITRTSHPSPALPNASIHTLVQRTEPSVVTPQTPSLSTQQRSSNATTSDTRTHAQLIPHSSTEDPQRSKTINGYHHYLPPPSFPCKNRYLNVNSFPYSYVGIGKPLTSASCPPYQIQHASQPHSIHSRPSLQTSSIKKAKIKLESGALPMATSTTTYNQLNGSSNEQEPLTLQERNVFSALKQMGFDNDNEIRQAIRSNVSPDTSNTASTTNGLSSLSSDAAAATTATIDSCMMWIIRQREEQEEAKKMDQARARSELLREETATARNKSAKEQFERSSIEELSSKMFSPSVILKFALNELRTLKDNHSEVLYNFLKLEDKIRLWYNDVSWCYFVDLAERWKSSSTGLTVVDLESIMLELETSLYSLEKQQGGIPAIFIQKRQDAERVGKPIRPSGSNLTDKPNIDQENIDDDDVIVLSEPPTKKSKTCPVLVPNVIIELD